MAVVSVTFAGPPGVLADLPPAIRLRPAPPLEPPYDDDVIGSGLIADGLAMLPLDWPGQPPPARPPGADRRELGPGPGVRAPASATPGHARHAAQRFVGVCVGVLN